MQPTSPAPLPPPPAPGQSTAQEVLRPPPGSGGLANNKTTLAVLAGCGCLGVLMVAAVMFAMVLMRRSQTPTTTPPSGFSGAPVAPSSAPVLPGPPR